MHVGPNDIAKYCERGWWISPPLLDEAELHRVQTACRRHQNDGVRDRTLPAKIDSSLDWKPGDPDRLRVSDFIDYQSDTVRMFVTENREIPQIAAMLSQSPTIRLFLSSFISKPPMSEQQAYLVSWHTDRAFWRTCSSDQMITAWIPFQDTDVGNGTLNFIRSSHQFHQDPRLSDLFDSRTFLDGGEDLPEQLRRLGLDVKIDHVTVPKGSVLFFHCRIFHCSGPNRSGGLRDSLVLHLQDASNRFRPAYREDGSIYYTNTDMQLLALSQSEPDLCDAGVCPQLYPHHNNINPPLE